MEVGAFMHQFSNLIVLFLFSQIVSAKTMLFSWLKLSLVLFFSWPCSSLAASALNGNETDTLALLEFKAKITDDPMGIMLSWNATSHFCQWHGVTCSRRHQRVVILNLQSLQLSGSLSPHIGNLSFLRELNLANNSFSKAIPPEVGYLRRLQKLKVSNNSFTGKIPSNISVCFKLSEISLAYNKLEGEFPEEFSTLSNLQVLSLQKANLSGRISPSLGNLSSLQVFSAPENHLYGSIPDAIGQLKNLQFFSLAANRLSGSMPLSIYNLSSIVTFNVAENRIQGKLPANLGTSLPNLEQFVIAKNDFTGSIPASFSNATNLKWIALSENKLTGRVPSLEWLHRLEVLSLSYNYLGSWGAKDLNFLLSLMNSTNLWIVEINRNRFGGVLPESISNFSINLSKFSIDENGISGRIPSGIVNLVNLEKLSMTNNLLSGNIPNDIGKLQNLKVLILQGNRLSGIIPSSLGNLTLLFELRLYNNQLEGNLPQSLGGCQNLMLLDVAKNNLSGKIPAQVIGLSSLSIFADFSANYFTGVIPKEIGNLKDVGELGISDNMLSGRIPDSLGSCIKLEVLALQGNFFHGSIPSSLGSLRRLQELDLSRNNLSGKIPEFFQSFVLLQTLNLSDNNFEGAVPVEGIFRNASAILLKGNAKLCGGISEFRLPKCNIKNHKKRMSLLLKIVISAVCSLSGLASLFTCALLYWLKNKRKEPALDPYKNLLLNLSYQDLVKATDGFAPANLIGTGSFGRVYKGILAEIGPTVAIKVLNLVDSRASKSFIAECEALKNIRHRNLVKVLTACSGVDYQGNDFKALVYEYMVNGSLEEWLHPIPRTEEGDHEPPKRLNLLQRLNIAIDVASALDYLHHQCQISIIHCDLKPSNVLLDDDMNGHVSDFGLAKILSECTNNYSTSQSSSIGVRGTLGYAPPEYGIGSQVSICGDVYSYGIMLLEMFTGKRPTDEMFKEDLNLHNFAKAAFPDQAAEIVDSFLLEETIVMDMRMNSTSQRFQDCLFSIIRVGVNCSAEIPQERMKINDVVAELNSIKNRLIGATIR